MRRLLSKYRLAAIALVAVMIASVAGYWGVGEYRKRTMQTAVTEMVSDTTARLRDALSADARTPTPSPLDLATSLDNQSNEVDKRLEALRRLDGAPNRPLFDAAELYIVTSRELLRRKASTYRHALQLSSSRKVLHGFMQDASRRSPTWIKQTMRAKEEFEKDAFNYRIAVDAIVKLLESFPDTRAKLAPHLDSRLLLDENVRAKAHEAAREASKQITDEVERARGFAALR
jgi:hypothetical protein